MSALNFGKLIVNKLHEWRFFVFYLVFYFFRDFRGWKDMGTIIKPKVGKIWEVKKGNVFWKEQISESKYWARESFLGYGFFHGCLATSEGGFEFVDIWVAAHRWKSFHARSLKFVFGHILDIIVGSAKLESFQCQLLLRIVSWSA